MIGSVGIGTDRYMYGRIVERRIGWVDRRKMARNIEEFK